MPLKKEARHLEFFSKKSKKLKITKLKKSTSSRHLCENFIDDENVPPNKFYNIPLKKSSRQYNFFSKKAKKPKMTKKLEKIHLPGISVKILLVTKTFPQTSSIRFRWKNIVIIWTFSSENGQNRFIAQKLSPARRSDSKSRRKLESPIHITAKKYIFLASYKKLYLIKYDSTDVFYKILSKKVGVCSDFSQNSKKRKMT